MICIVSAGATSEPLDAVRRLTNFSTGKLGSELADYLADSRHEVFLLRSAISNYQAESRAAEVLQFETTQDLEDRFHSLANRGIDAVFHAAAVSDFRFGRIWTRSSRGELSAINKGKLDSRDGPFVVELIPTPKLLAQLRDLFPQAWLVGWKYEVDGDRTSAVASAEKQIVASRTDACVINGPAFGEGFGFLARGGDLASMSNSIALFECLGKCLIAKY